MAKAIGRASASPRTKKPRHTTAQKKAAAQSREIRSRAARRPERSDRDDRAPRRELTESAPQRAERGERPARREWTERPPRREWSDRAPQRDDRGPQREGSAERPARREWTERPPRREWSDRAPQRDDRGPQREGSAERPARREWTERPPRREWSDRAPQREGSAERPARREWTERPPRREWSDRAPQREGSAERPPRREWTERPPRREWSDRAPQREGSAERPPRREWTERPPRREWTDRAPQRTEQGERPYGASHHARTTAPAFHETPQHDRLERHHDRQEVRRHPAAPAPEIVRGAELEALVQDGPFSQLGLDGLLVRKLAELGITEPFPIQAATIPDALAGRDILGRGQTGSGKTMAFGLPTIQRLAAGPRASSHKPRALIVTPTRELAMQVTDALRPLLDSMKMRYMLVAGGMSYTPQLSALDRGVELLVATPGRLMDLIERGAADLSEVQITVLDEADHMAQMGFLEAITEILDLIPQDGQRLLFSATLDHGIQGLATSYLHDPVTHETDAATASVETMEHHLFLVHPHHKRSMIAAVANREGRTVVFVRTKLGADRVAEQLREQGVFAAALHGGLNQSARNRVLDAFKAGDLPVLVATDVAARGIHVDDVSLVLQVDPPADHKDYLHRSGRTARAGDRGAVVTLALPHQKRTMTRLLEAAGVITEAVPIAPDDAAVVDLAGGRMPSGEAIPVARLEALLAPRRPARRPGGRNPGRPGGSRPHARRPRHD